MFRSSSGTLFLRLACTLQDINVADGGRIRAVKGSDQPGVLIARRGFDQHAAHAAGRAGHGDLQRRTIGRRGRSGRIAQDGSSGG